MTLHGGRFVVGPFHGTVDAKRRSSGYIHGQGWDCLIVGICLVIKRATWGLSGKTEGLDAISHLVSSKVGDFTNF